MSDSIDFDFSDVLKLAADLEKVPRAASNNIRKAVSVTARHVKDDWKKPLEGSSTVPQGAHTITYDLTGGEGVRAEAIEAEIGPELDRGQGPIVGMLEYGTPTVSPRGFGAAALKKNEPDFVQGLQIALADAEKEAGL